jgi:hypothetical protein
MESLRPKTKLHELLWYWRPAWASEGRRRAQLLAPGSRGVAASLMASLRADGGGECGRFVKALGVRRCEAEYRAAASQTFRPAHITQAHLPRENPQGTLWRRWCLGSGIQLAAVDMRRGGRHRRACLRHGAQKRRERVRGEKVGYPYSQPMWRITACGQWPYAPGRFSGAAREGDEPWPHAVVRHNLRAGGHAHR